MQKFKHMSMQVCKYTSLQVCRYGMQLYKYKNIGMEERKYSILCNLQLYNYVSLPPYSDDPLTSTRKVQRFYWSSIEIFTLRYNPIGNSSR